MTPTQIKALEDSHRDLMDALEPFAAWAHGISKVEQQDSFIYRELDDQGRVVRGRVIPSDFSLATFTLNRARKLTKENEE